MSFKYEVQDTPEGVQVMMTNFSWKGPAFSLLWISAWSFGAFRFFTLVEGFGAVALLAALICGFMASLGVYLLVLSLRRRTMLLSPTELQLRSSFLGIAVTTRFRVDEIANLGFANLSHSFTPVLKFELQDKAKPARRPKWVILASWVTQKQVDEFLQTLATSGFALPR